RRTGTAAARVRWRNATSPSLNRANAREREMASLARTAPPCNARSTTSRLPAGCIQSSQWFRFREPTQAASSQPRKCRFFTVDKERRECAPFPICRAQSEDWLAGVILDVLFPDSLDLLHDAVGHRDVIEFLVHLGAVLVRPGEG